MRHQLDIEKFMELKQMELGSSDHEVLDKLKYSTESIYRWLQYCQYHYHVLKRATTTRNLWRDKALSYRRAGEVVPLRYVYEANISAFLNNLHALVDSFPYLLNLFITVENDFDNTRIKWHENFLKEYSDMPFYSELIDLMMDNTLHKVKGYVNTIKHKYLIRIANHGDRLEFEKYNYKKPYSNARSKLTFSSEEVQSQNVITFIEKCHDTLIPKLLNLSNSLLLFKESEG